MAGEERAAARLGGVEAGRLVGALLVVLLHCLPNPAFGGRPPVAVLLLGAAARAAVPFFFVASGLFLAVRPEPMRDTLRRTAGRLLRLHLFWLLVYAAVFSTPLPSFNWQWKPSILWTGGAGFQLWFLPVLAASRFAVAAAVPRIGWGATVALAAGIAAVGLWAVYGLHPHLPAPFWFPRMCQGPVLVLAGVALARSRTELRPRSAAGLVLLAWPLSLGEDALIARLGGQPLTYQEFDLSTCGLGIAAAALARGWTGWTPPPRWRAASLGLRLYCVHVLFLWPLLHWIGTGAPGRTTLLFAAVCALSLGAAWLCGRVPWLARITV